VELLVGSGLCSDGRADQENDQRELERGGDP
jgi:hypothetical protein